MCQAQHRPIRGEDVHGVPWSYVMRHEAGTQGPGWELQEMGSVC